MVRVSVKAQIDAEDAYMTPHIDLPGNILQDICSAALSKQASLPPRIQTWLVALQFGRRKISSGSRYYLGREAMEERSD
jgi:hypothetical protein